MVGNCLCVPSGFVGTRLRDCLSLIYALASALGLPFFPRQKESMGDWRESLPCSGEEYGGRMVSHRSRLQPCVPWGVLRLGPGRFRTQVSALLCQAGLESAAPPQSLSTCSHSSPSQSIATLCLRIKTGGTHPGVCRRHCRCCC